MSNLFNGAFYAMTTYLVLSLFVAFYFSWIENPRAVQTEK
jgi:hypothetical protein